MGGKSKIEWTDASWTPVRAMKIIDHGGGIAEQHGRIGWHCEHVSEGCRNCYAETMNQRLGTGLDFKPGHRKDIELFLDEKMLLQPFKWKRPRRTFVCSMTDLFADFVKDEWIDRMFAVMALCPQHTFQILTKRPERMREYLTRAAGSGKQDPRNHIGFVSVCEVLDMVAPKWTDEGIDGKWRSRGIQACRKWPLPNVWLGTSCEDQAAADARILHLLATPAAIRFLSGEPLLGEIDLASPYTMALFNATLAEDVARGIAGRTNDEEAALPGLHWVIAGGESGRDARPMHPDWARSLRDQCADAGVKFFFKQWGEFAPTSSSDVGNVVRVGRDGSLNDADATRGDASTMRRCGKANAGRTLDGKTHDAYPEVAP